MEQLCTAAFHGIKKSYMIEKLELLLKPTCLLTLIRMGFLGVSFAVGVGWGVVKLPLILSKTR